MNFAVSTSLDDTYGMPRSVRPRALLRKQVGDLKRLGDLSLVRMFGELDRGPAAAPVEAIVIREKGSSRAGKS